MSGLRLAFTTLTLLIAVTAAPAADVISGVPYIVDGDTLSIGNLKFRLGRKRTCDGRGGGSDHAGGGASDVGPA